MFPFVCGALTPSVVGTPQGWEWINESKTPRPKWGYVSTAHGSVLRLQLDTRAVQLASNGAADSTGIDRVSDPIGWQYVCDSVSDVVGWQYWRWRCE